VMLRHDFTNQFNPHAVDQKLSIQSLSVSYKSYKGGKDAPSCRIHETVPS